MVSIENITSFGIWLFVKSKKYFLSYEDYPHFKNHILNSIQRVQLPNSYHLFWQELNDDPEINNLENPERYPLKCMANVN